MKAPKFRDFITEQKQSYKLLVITDEPENQNFSPADNGENSLKTI